MEAATSYEMQQSTPRWLAILYDTQFLFQTKQAFGGYAGRTMRCDCGGCVCIKGGR